MTLLIDGMTTNLPCEQAGVLNDKNMLNLCVCQTYVLMMLFSTALGWSVLGSLGQN